MRCAYVINSLECGGAQLPIPDIVRVIRAQNVEVTVFSLAEKDGLAIPILDAAGIPVRVRRGSTTDHLCAYRWLHHELHTYRPDLVWTSLTRASLLGQIVANQLGVPTVHWQHAARLKPVNALLLKLCRKRTKLWIADSLTVKKSTRKALGITDKLTHWPIFQANPAAPIARQWREGEPVRIGTLGRLHAVKGYDLLCEAVRLLKTHPALPPFTLTIAGEGPERAALQDKIDRDNLPVTLAGHCSEPMAFLGTLHLYVQPSHWEGMCIAAHEAMSCGLAVIATPAGELASSVVDEETGLIVPFNNAPALARAIAALLLQPETREKMGTRARERLQRHYSAEVFTNHGRTIMSRLLQGLSESPL